MIGDYIMIRGIDISSWQGTITPENMHYVISYECE